MILELSLKSIVSVRSLEYLEYINSMRYQCIDIKQIIMLYNVHIQCRGLIMHGCSSNASYNIDPVPFSVVLSTVFGFT